MMGEADHPFPSGTRAERLREACVIADGSGRALAFALAPGQAHQLPMAPGLLDRLPRGPLWVVGDRGYSSDTFRQLIWSSGARPAIPTRSNEAAVACPAWIYDNRNLVERLWGRLKEWRAIATRYETTAGSTRARSASPLSTTPLIPPPPGRAF